MQGPRHLVSIDDLSIAEIQALFEHARSFSDNLRGSSELCRGLISASIFYEPSTRTRLSFESAMLRLGGGVVTAADMSVSSAVKGESLADTVRVVSGAYADILVLRHPAEGAARLATRFSQVPVINAGDGSHEHPTQTLCDLYTLWIEKGRIEGLDVVLSGDLRYSRTIHSFVYALARFGANLVCVPHQGLELPDYVVKRLREEYGAEPQAADATRLGDLAAQSDALYITPTKPHQLSLYTEARRGQRRVEHVDAVYMTRPQTERFAEDDNANDYVHLNSDSMAGEALAEAVVMHPLPRRDEISPDFDQDPRSIYFRQAARGVPIRMAILGMLLGRIDLGEATRESHGSLHQAWWGGNPCPNLGCVSHTETRQAAPLFRIISRFPVRAVCGYCSREFPVGLVAGRGGTQPVDPASTEARRIDPNDLILFRDAEEASSFGFEVQPTP
jgi:aspartate carbamoyltransferase catalytic subunit